MAGVDAEVDEERALINRSAHDVLAIVPRRVVAEERSLEGVDDVVALHGDLERVNGLRVNRNSDLLAGLDVREGLDELRPGSGDGARLDRAVRPRGLVHDLVGHASQVVPVAVLVLVGCIDVDAREHADIDELSRPLHLRQEHVVVRHGELLLLEAVDANQSKTDALDVDVVDLRVHEDVVDVQLGEESLRRVDIRARDEDGLVVDLAINSVDVLRDGSSGAGTSSISADLSGDAQEEIAGRAIDNVLLLLESNSDETLAVRDRDGRNGQANVFVEPEEQRDPEIQRGLQRLRGLRAADDLHDLARSDGGIRGSDLRAADISERGERRGERVSSGDRRRVRVTLNGNLLADETLPADLLIMQNPELAIEHRRLARVGIERVSVDLELHLPKQHLSGVLAIAHEVGHCSADRNDNTGGVDVLLRVSGVSSGNNRRTERSGNRGHADLRSGSDRHNIGSDRGRERRNGALSAGNRAELDMRDHVGEELTISGDAEEHLSAESDSAGLRANLGVLVRDRSERLVVGIDEENVSLLDIGQVRGHVLETRALPLAHDIANTRVEQVSRMKHAIRAPVAGEQLEDSTGRHLTSC